jgi:hypothetical protein
LENASTGYLSTRVNYELLSLPSYRINITTLQSSIGKQIKNFSFSQVEALEVKAPSH